MTCCNFIDEPIVVEMPSSAEGVGIFGTIMDAWQRPIDDVVQKDVMESVVMKLKKGVSVQEITVVL